MTEQLKAEAFVRSQRPALLELSFGCEVRTSTEGVYKLGNESYLQFWLDVDRNGLPSGWTIIGHPINLQDWLQELGKACGGNVSLSAGNNVCYTTHLPIEKITFNLPDGQPATEADYKAFNDIVGI